MVSSLFFVAIDVAAAKTYWNLQEKIWNGVKNERKNWKNLKIRWKKGKIRIICRENGKFVGKIENSSKKWKIWRENWKFVGQYFILAVKNTNAVRTAAEVWKICQNYENSFKNMKDSSKNH